MSDWVPRNKYEVAPGLFIGSEIGDIDREIKVLMGKWIRENDEDAFRKICPLQDRRMELILPRRLRDVRSRKP